MKRDAKIIVAGTKDYSNYSQLISEVTDFLEFNRINKNVFNSIEFISGGPESFDKLVALLAVDLSAVPTIFSPDYENFYNGAAELMNNSVMIDYATHCIVFWDGKDDVLKHLIDLANYSFLPTKVITYT